MNRYPIWKYAILVVALLIGVLYTLPNFFGEAPAVQVSSAKATVKVDAAVLQRVEEALRAAGLSPDYVSLEGNSVRARFDTPDNQLKAKDAIQKALIPDPADPAYIVALNLVSRSPTWLSALHAQPMYLGLDLRGGVHFMLQVDMQAALTKKAESYAGDIRTALRDKNIRHGGISRDGQAVEIRVRDEATRTATSNLIADQFTDLQVVVTPDGAEFKLRASIKPEATRRVQEQALKQNITTLHNRINELGVAEPVIQQQGLDRIVVQLPGVQDTAKAKDILGRTATLEVRLVDESTEARAAERGQGAVPFGSERYLERNGQPVIVKKQVILTGENLTDAQPGFDGQTQEPTVNLTLDAKGARIFKDVTRENINKRMAIVLFEKGKGEVVTAPVIRSEIGGGRVQISGRMTTAWRPTTPRCCCAPARWPRPWKSSRNTPSAPASVRGQYRAWYPQRGVGLGWPSLRSCACTTMLFGVISSIALAVNVMLLVAMLSMLQATLTLPGIAAMALAIGVAIDSNVLINERVREELRAGCGTAGGHPHRL
jgi:preprotein translocase subunit SecD